MAVMVAMLMVMAMPVFAKGGKADGFGGNGDAGGRNTGNGDAPGQAKKQSDGCSIIIIDGVE